MNWKEGFRRIPDRGRHQRKGKRNWMEYTAQNHTWVVCAYKESPYLEECIKSLLAQTVQSRIIISTSTWNEYMRGIAERYGIKAVVNDGKSAIGTDWNFALQSGETELLTIAHQDDIYEKEYTEEMLRRMNRCRNPILFSSNYAELRAGRKVTNNKLLRIKHLLVTPIRLFPGWKFARRCSLAFGCPICCPSITYRKSIMQEYAFSDAYQCDLDWDMEERLSRLKGSFAYSRKPLMCHRIHEESATTELIASKTRAREDYEIMRRFWPEWIAKRLCRKYAKAEKSNQI